MKNILLPIILILTINTLFAQAPTGLQAEGFNTTVRLSWNEYTDFEVVGYNIYQTLNSGQYTTSPTRYIGNYTEHTDYNLIPDSDYFYKISAFDRYGNESALTEEIAVSTNNNSYLKVANLDMLFPIYTGGMPAGEVEEIKASMNFVRDFYFRNTSGQLNFNIHYMVIEGYPPLNANDQADFGTIGADLSDRGILNYQYDICHIAANKLYGFWGGTWFLGQTGASMAYYNWANDGTNHYAEGNAWVMTHEIGHTIDLVVSHYSGYPEMLGNHYSQDLVSTQYQGEFDAGESFDGMATVLRKFDHYLDYQYPWEGYIEVIDSDNDGLANNDSRIAFDEAAFFSNPFDVDSDDDSLSDLEEYIADNLLGSNPNNMDSDGDGIMDGLDIYPTSNFNPEIRKSTLQTGGFSIDGQMSATENWQPLASNPWFSKMQDATMDTYASWDDDNFYFYFSSSEELKYFISFDGSGEDGLWMSDIKWPDGVYNVSNGEAWGDNYFDISGLITHYGAPAVYLHEQPIPGSVVQSVFQNGKYLTEIKLPHNMGKGYGYTYVKDDATTITANQYFENDIIGFGLIGAKLDQMATLTGTNDWRYNSWLTLNPYQHLYDFTLMPAETSSALDLSLDLTVDDSNYEAFDYVSYTLSVDNNSDTDAENVIIDFPLPEGTVFADLSISQGNYYNWTGKWNVGTVPANSSAAMELIAFTIVGGPSITAYAQIESASPDDVDSTPNNGTCCTPNEDDEAAITIYSVTTGESTADLSLDMTLFATTCGDLPECNTTEFQFSIFVTNNGPDDAENVTVKYADGTSFYIGTVAAGTTFSNGIAWTVVVDGNPGENPQMPFPAFAQIETSDANDPDSTPGNNNTFVVNEDDESLVEFGPTEEGIDLTLDISSDSNTYDIYSNVTYNVSVSNTGNETAQDVIVSIPMPAGMVHTSNAPSQGTYSDWTGKWKVGSLAPNTTAQMELVLFTLIDNQNITTYAQVLSASGDDVDSTPGNGTCCTPNEDDEAAATVKPSGGGTASADLSLEMTLFAITCGDLPDCNTTEFQFSIFVTNDGPDDANNVTVKYADGNIFNVGTVAAGTTFSNGIAWTVTLDENPSQNPQLPFPAFAQIETSSVDDPDSTPGNDTNYIADEDDESLVELTQEGGDLELTMTSNTNEYDIYGNVTYYLTIENTGTENASDIVVSFPLPEGMVHTSHTTTQGPYSDWTGKWKVGNLAPNESAFLELVLFTLVDNQSLTTYAQVLSANLDDIDSTPGNGTCCTPNEDDEVAITIYPATTENFIMPEMGVSHPHFYIEKLFPNPAKDELILQLTSNFESSEYLTIVDQLGREVMIRNLELMEGYNQVLLDIDHLKPGVYFIYLSNNNQRMNRINKFVKIED